MERLLQARNLAARQIKNIRRFERSSVRYVTDRNIEEYSNLLDGLQHSLLYAKNLPNSNIILDIGAGNTRGIFEIATSLLGEGISCEATVLVKHKESSRFLGLFGKEKIHITSAEVLRGIENDSIAGVLALYSIAYSAAPELVIRRIDEVLVKGGFIKALFRDPDSVKNDSAFVRKTDFKTHHPFSSLLKKFGYDVALLRSKDGFLAIKPGGKFDITAERLRLFDSGEVKIKKFSSYLSTNSV